METIKKDLHVPIYQKLETIIASLGLEDVATVLQNEDFTHFCNKTNISTRLNHIFSKDIEEYDVISCEKK